MIYTWLRQIVIFYILSALIVNAIVSDKYKNYIKIIARLILIIIVISPVINFLSGKDNVKNNVQKLYKNYTAAYNNTCNITDGFSYTKEDVIKQVIKQKVKDVLAVNNITADDVKVIIKTPNTYKDNSMENNNDMTVASVIITADKLKKTDIEQLKQNISSETGIDNDKIHIK